jgi:competence transcription factor ComK
VASIGVRLQPEALRSRDSATFTGSYQTLGSALSHSACLVKFVNNSTVTVTVSWDGSSDHDIYPSGSFAVYDVTTNTQQSGGLYIPKGTQFYVKGSAGTGSVYLIVLYPYIGS